MYALELSKENLDMLVEFEKNARVTEPDIFLEGFNEEVFKDETLNAIDNPIFSSARCLMCVDDDKGVVGRIDFSILSSFAFGGDLRVYVDWIYVLKECRHKGVAQFLFKEMEGYLAKLGINEYFLLTAENDEAQRFYKSLTDARIEKKDVLTKNLG